MTRTRAVLATYERLPYAVAWSLQHALHAERVANQRPDTLLIVEHDPVFTLGRTTKAAHWAEGSPTMQSAGIPVFAVERGGSITYHAPGQIVLYPILRLADHCAGPKSYVRLLEEVLLRVLAEWGIPAVRRDKLPGLWVAAPQPAKIASIGVRIARGITLHGCALNVAVDLSPFSWIVPCGIEGCRVTSMERALDAPIDKAQVKRRLSDLFAEVFQLEWTLELTDPTQGTPVLAADTRLPELECVTMASSASEE